MPTAISQSLDLLYRYAEECRLLITWVDILDIVFIGALLSIALAWLHGRTARAVLFAFAPLLVALGAAKSLKMYMTSVVFQFGLTALLLSIVVIFQDDFRRAFEGLATWRPWGRTRIVNSAKLAELLCNALTTLAENKTGALIVLQGRQSIDVYLRAGISLHGTISIPVLLSIFDPSSPGHDGGVVIADGRISMFGAHLPLSRNAEETGRLGTRHAAALGLAEKGDALVLVVSEETGEISLAQMGKIAVAKSASEVRDTIAKQFRRIGSTSVPRTLWEIPWLRLTASYTVAIALWFVFARPANPIIRTVEASIVYRGLRQGWGAKPPEPTKVKITLFGPEGPLMAIDPATMAVSVDLVRAGEGEHRFVLGESDVSLPVHVRIQRFEPSEILVETYQTATSEIPVALTWLESGGRAPSSALLRITPSTVMVKLPRSHFIPATLQTEPIDLRELKRLGRLQVKLRVPPESPNAELATSEVELTLSSPID